jgi:MFS family permease
VNVALPSIAGDLSFSEDHLQRVISAYVHLGVCTRDRGLLMLGGRTSDLFGRRRIFVGGSRSSLWRRCSVGLAPSSEALIASRAAEGLGAALLTPAALSIATTITSRVG